MGLRDAHSPLQLLKICEFPTDQKSYACIVFPTSDLPAEAIIKSYTWVKVGEIFTFWISPLTSPQKGFVPYCHPGVPS